MDPTQAQLVEFLRSIHARPGGTGSVLNLIRVSEVRGATDVAALSDVVADPKIKLDLARHASDEARHSYILLRRMVELGFQAFRLPPELDRVDGLLARSRARDVKQVYAERGSVADAELMELLIAALIPERDAITKFHANYEALDADHRTRSVIGGMLRDEERHIAYLESWLRWFETRFSSRAVKTARERLEQTFDELTAVYYGGLNDYFARVAA
jgi:rubrerythrin